MRNLLFIFLSLFLCLRADFISAQSVRDYPSFNSVASNIRNQYGVGDYTSVKQIKLARKPDGWYILFMDYAKDIYAPYQEEIVWSLKSKSFTKLKLLKKTKTITADWHPSNENDTADFKVNLFYGYSKWSDDIIKVLASKTNLNDTLTYQLARAYSSKAAIEIWNTGDYSPPMLFDKTFDAASFPAGMIDRFVFNISQSIKYFRKVYDMNPRFEVLVGNIYTKWSNEYLYAWSVLSISGFPEVAANYLPDNIYDEAMLATAKNYLSSCEQNAIIITNGDNDTYPLMYVQEKFSLRKDVVIANNSLMNTARYLHFLRTKYSLKFSLDDNDYVKMDNAVLRIEKSDSTKEFASLAADIKKFPAANISGEYNSAKTDKIKLPVSIWNKKSGNTYTRSELTFNFNKSWMFTTDLATLDLINSNPDRTICFAVTIDPDIIKPIENHLINYGLVNRINKETYPGNAQGIQVNLGDKELNQLLDLELNKFDYSEKYIDTVNFRRMRYTLLYQLMNTSEALLEQEKKIEAKKILDKTTPLTASLDQRQRLYIELLLLKQYIVLDESEIFLPLKDKFINEATVFVSKMEKNAAYYKSHSSDEVSLWLYFMMQLSTDAVFKTNPTQQKKVDALYEKLKPYYHQ